MMACKNNNAVGYILLIGKLGYKFILINQIR